MSRDRRQRESRRRSRRASEESDAPDEGAPDPESGFVRSSLPAAISGDVDEFDAALARGAGGVPAPLDDADFDEAEDQREDREPVAASNGGGNGRGGGLSDDPFGRGDEEEGGGGSGLPAPRDHARQGGHSLPSRAVAFGRSSWAELQRVQWPDREQVFQATAVVLGFVAVAGVFLFAADWVAEHIIKAIL